MLSVAKIIQTYSKIKEFPKANGSYATGNIQVIVLRENHRKLSIFNIVDLVFFRTYSGVQKFLASVFRIITTKGMMNRKTIYTLRWGIFERTKVTQLAINSLLFRIRSVLTILISCEFRSDLR